MHASPKWCLGHIFQVLEHMAESDEINALGFQFAQAARQLRERREDAVLQAQANDPDLIRLHRSEKTKSGFVGVYSNGNGFRAEGRDPVNRKGSVTLGSFKTAELAAIARLRHYRRHGIPYGALEVAIDHLCQTEPDKREWSTERLKHEVIYEYASQGRPLDGLTDEERVYEQTDPYAERLARALTGSSTGVVKRFADREIVKAQLAAQLAAKAAKEPTP
jgi:hypothetical protein